MDGRSSRDGAPRVDPPAHETRVRVRYGECDRMGVVYHAHYIVYFELGRTEYLRALGETYRRVEDEGTLLVVVETGARYHRPARYDDLLTVRTRLSELGGVRLRFEYEVTRDGEILATGFTVLASTTREGRPCRMPAAFRERVAGAALADGGKSRTARAVQGASRGGPSS